MGNLGCCETSVDTETFREYVARQATADYKTYIDNMPQTLDADYTAGSWEAADRPTGSGVIFSADKFYYEGEIVEGRAEGSGRIVLPNHTAFSGSFSENKANGYGELKFEDEDVSLVGLWEMGHPKLNEKLILNNKNKKATIIFLPREAQPHREEDKGDDELTVHLEFQEGTSYRGDIKSKKGKVYKIEGKGEMRFADGSYYSGSFLEGKMHGVGNYFWTSTGHRYEGEYSNNFRNGYGKYFYDATHFKEGIWKGGVLQPVQAPKQATE